MTALRFVLAGRAIGAAGRILSALLATRAAVDVEDRLAALETAAATAEGGAR